MDYGISTDEMVRRLGAIPDAMGAGTCFGSPIERNGHTLIPVARVNFGYGLGFGGGSGFGSRHGKGIPDEFGTPAEGGEGGGGGGGGGGSSSPVAVVDISDGDVVVKPITDTTRIAMSWMALIAWAAFWLMLTVRTVAREGAKTHRLEIEKTMR